MQKAPEEAHIEQEAPKETQIEWETPEEVKVWTRIFHVRPHLIGEIRFFIYLWKIDFWKKSWSRHLFYFYFWRENKTRNKKKKKNDSIIFGKACLWKPESWSGDQVTYWEGTSRR